MIKIASHLPPDDKRAALEFISAYVQGMKERVVGVPFLGRGLIDREICFYCSNSGAVDAKGFHAAPDNTLLAEFTFPDFCPACLGSGYSRRVYS